MNKPLIIMPDVQGSEDTRQLAINRVGIKSLRHPLEVRNRDGSTQSSVATVDMSVSLAHDCKGTHMSRFIEILNSNEEPLSFERYHDLLVEVAERLEANRGFVEMQFPFFIRKQAPASGVAGYMDYEVTMRGEIEDGVVQTTLEVLVPVTSLCPCSKKISAYGAHNQRSHVTITARPVNELCIEDLIDVVQQQASSELFAILKRMDEKLVTERAYDNPKFVEDMVRDVAAALNQHPKVAAYIVAAENFESIHNHSAYAEIEWDKQLQQPIF